LGVPPPSQHRSGGWRFASKTALWRSKGSPESRSGATLPVQPYSKLLPKGKTKQKFITAVGRELLLIWAIGVQVEQWVDMSQHKRRAGYLASQALESGLTMKQSEQRLSAHTVRKILVRSYVTGPARQAYAWSNGSSCSAGGASTPKSALPTPG